MTGTLPGWPRRWSAARSLAPRPAWAVAGCLVVAATEALSIAFQVTDVAIAHELVAHELVALLPYVTTLAVLVLVRGDRRRPPRSLGEP